MTYKFKPDAYMDKHPDVKANTDYDSLKTLKLEELLIKAKSGDKTAAGEICERFNGMIVNSARSFYINGYTMEDMMQEGRVSLIRAIQKYDLDSRYPFASYAAGAVKKNFYCKIRDNVKKSSCCSLQSINSKGNELMDMIASEQDIEEDLIKRQEKINLWKALGKLPQEERNIIIWYYVQDRSLKEYGIKKGISYRTAAYRKRKAIEHLRNIMRYV
ncbi:sigma-70 family RNA polymerase sigma factor [Clostridium sp. JNZ X4-2]